MAGRDSTLAAYLAVALIGTILAYYGGVWFKHYGGKCVDRAIKDLTLDSYYTLRIHDSFSHLKPALIGRIGLDTESSDFRDCGIRGDVNALCVDQIGKQQLQVVRTEEENVVCYDVRRKALQTVSQEIKDCFSLSAAQWYGGFQHVHQPWPLNAMNLDLQPFVSTDMFTHKSDIGGVIERYFINSNGVGIRISNDVPLYVSMNQSGDGEVCLVSKSQGYPYMNNNNVLPELNYTICRASNIKLLHDAMSRRYIDRPENIPDEKMFRFPVWSTWAQFNKNINETLLMEFAKAIKENDFSYSQIEIDDDWTPLYGDQEFDINKFPDPGKMIRTLNNMGFRVTVWVHPFMEVNSKAYKEAAREKHVVMTTDGSAPALVKWWNGDEAGLLDVTNSNAVQRFLERLRNLRASHNVSSFKFDAGEAFYYPRSYSIKSPYPNPENYARLWADLAYQSDTAVRHQEVRVGWSSQKYPIFVRLFDRMSSWGYDTGLKTVIPAILTFGILGYPFVLPDMIGGNAYQDDITFSGGAYPERELFIRWLQVNTFLPAVQFSIAPWIYDAEVVTIAKAQMKLRKRYADTIISLAKESVKQGSPIIRPLWWISPEDEIALTTDSEFLLGDDLLVAPVLDKGANSRDIYLPRGLWVDQLNGDKKQGPIWLKDYPAEIEDLPHFTRQRDT
ncbi:myogenesis-regulating glycosidase-like [Haliotis rufescens]|uniref:myogenesis-regulating glycosidase-like n=1 Tax=Haliotis rufescens TaxID=6454 RepID=UPI001EAF91E0|nr:myogenesis-regulating glycosidase-like [Haliotis rufescens]XP_046346311.1 myogenesis-regulating glycosidase-like [Haliotis rufescens]XP_046346312.1 myogenesis-regulating glycosidase-like [Haliotis rufescens]XP_048250116.1 myogenesis-regulating glycosidase-like [Haliotis rufescens]